MIVHVLDAATLESDRDPLHDLEVIEAELATYSQRLADDGSATGRLPLMSPSQKLSARAHRLNITIIHQKKLHMSAFQLRQNSIHILRLRGKN